MKTCKHTIDASVVRLDKSLLDLAVLDNKRIPLAAVVSKHRGAVEGDVQGLGEFTSRVTQEADLCMSASVKYCRVGRTQNIHHCYHWGQ